VGDVRRGKLLPEYLVWARREGDSSFWLARNVNVTIVATFRMLEWREAAGVRIQGVRKPMEFGYW
jgi:hypothetical protein